MCRVSIFNKAGEAHIEDTYGMVKFLDRLEKECGGHGNGLALMKDGQIIYLNKGVKYTNEMIARKLARTDYDHAIYHTRIKSVGEVSSKNCHPYRSGNTVLAMNGTEQGFAGLARMLDITDSEAVLRAAIAFNKDVRDVSADICGATFVGFHKGMPWLVASASSWSGLQFVKTQDMYVFASTLPAEFKNRKQVSGKRQWYYPTDSLEDITFTEVRDIQAYATNLRGYQDYWERKEKPAAKNPVARTATGWQHVRTKDDEGNVLEEEEWFEGKWASQIPKYTNKDLDACREDKDKK